MSSRDHDKNKEMIKELEKTISPVLVVNNSSLKPYVELFEYSPENIYQQPLGSLVGFFEIKEYSQDSAYIVNFLTSVLKKEYYINPKRPVTESLDSALHKVNLALSELAKQGNVEWLGKLNAAICVLEKNNAHFSVTGSAKIFLYRNNVLSNISDGIASDSLEPHPLKTFVNVSSGRLEKNDRLLITPEDIFHIFSVDDLKKNLQRFAGDKFVQFLKTALSNQLEMISIIVIEMAETKPVGEVKMSVPRKKLEAVANVFSEKTFAKTPKQAATLEETPEDKIDYEEIDREYIDKKTGHIYVQGEDDDLEKTSRANIYWDMTKEKISQGWYSTKNDLRRRFSIYKKQLAKKRALRKVEKEKQAQILAEEKKHEQEKKALAELELSQQIELEKQQALEVQKKVDEIIEQEQAPEVEQVTEIQQQETIELITEQPESSEEIIEIEQSEEIIPKKELSFKEKLTLAMAEERRNALNRLGIENEQVDLGKNLSPEQNAIDLEEKVSKLDTFKSSFEEILQKSGQKLKTILASIQPATKKVLEKIKLIHFDTEKTSEVVPHFSKIRNLFSSFTNKQKLYTLLAFVLIFIVPFFIVHWMNNRPKPQTITKAEVKVPTLSEILANEKNINLSASEQTVLSRNDIVNTLVINTGTAVVTKTGVIVIENGQQKEYALPENSGTIIKAAFMKDLSLVFILTDQNKLISFSPVSTKFTDNNISLPANISNDFIGTYLTYLYILDPQDNQIYRYPRAAGGFGDKTNWLKDNTPLAGISDMTIDDNIYCIQNNSVLKLFKGTKQDLTLEASTTPVHFDNVFTTIDSGSLYVLDTKNSRIIQYNKADGTITAQYFNEALADGKSLSIDEASKVAYISTSSELISISIQ
jgi:hypothetical protein